MEALGPIKIWSGLEKGSSFFFQAWSGAALRLLVHLMSRGVLDTPTVPGASPPLPLLSVFVLQLPHGACSCVNPRRVSAQLWSLHGSTVALHPWTLFHSPHVSRIFPFSGHYSVAWGAFQQHPPQPWCRIWKKHLKPILCRNLLRSDFYLMSKDTPFSFLPRGNLTPSSRLRESEELEHIMDWMNVYGISTVWVFF